MPLETSPKNNQLFVIGMIFLVLSFSLFAFTAYLLPYLLLEWIYDVPEFIVKAQEILHDDWNLSERLASWLIFLFFLIISAVASIGAYVISDLLDRNNATLETKEKRMESKLADTSEETKETLSVLSKIILIVVAVFLGAMFLQWLLYTTSPTL